MSLIVDGGPWYFGGRPIFLQKWKPCMNLSKAGCKQVPIWVHFSNIPLEYWNEEGLSFIASVVGKPLHADKMTESVKCINYARICIEVRIDAFLPNSFNLELGAGSVVEILADYNWVPKKCDYCKEFGHFINSCKMQPRQEWAPKVPSSSTSTSHPSNDGDWQQVRRTGKAPVVDRTPSPTHPSGLDPKVQQVVPPKDSANNNPFAILASSDIDHENVISSYSPTVMEEDGPLAILNGNGAKIPSLPCSSLPLLAVDITHHQAASQHTKVNMPRDDCGRIEDTPSLSDSGSSPLNLSLIQKVTSVDEFDSKMRKKNVDSKMTKEASVGAPCERSS